MKIRHPLTLGDALRWCAPTFLGLAAFALLTSALFLRANPPGTINWTDNDRGVHHPWVHPAEPTP